MRRFVVDRPEGLGTNEKVFCTSVFCGVLNPLAAWPVLTVLNSVNVPTRESASSRRKEKIFPTAECLCIWFVGRVEPRRAWAWNYLAEVYFVISDLSRVFREGTWQASMGPCVCVQNVQWLMVQPRRKRVGNKNFSRCTHLNTRIFLTAFIGFSKRSFSSLISSLVSNW